MIFVSEDNRINHINFKQYIYCRVLIDKQKGMYLNILTFKEMRLKLNSGKRNGIVIAFLTLCRNRLASSQVFYSDI